MYSLKAEQSAAKDRTDRLTTNLNFNTNRKTTKAVDEKMLNKLERRHSRYSISHTTRQILKKKCLNVEYDIRPIR